MHDYWDGIYSGKLVSEGVYFYILEAVEECSSDKIKEKGEITVSY